MKPRLVFSRSRKVRRSFTIDDRIVKKYMDVYGISIIEAKHLYKKFILGTQLSKPNLYA